MVYPCRMFDVEYHYASYSCEKSRIYILKHYHFAKFLREHVHEYEFQHKRGLDVIGQGPMYHNILTQKEN